MLKKTLLLLAFFFPLSAFAGSLHIGDYFLKGAEKVSDDVYVMGQTATFAGAVTGDATALSRTIFTEGDISADAFLLGESIKVLGSTGDDLRVVGERVVIDGTVGDDVVVIGSRVTIGPKAVIKGSLYAIGGSVEVQGTVVGRATVISGNLTLTGAIGGDLELWGGAVFGEPAKVGGDYILHNNAKNVPPLNVVITGKFIKDDLSAHKSTGFSSPFSGGFFSLKVLMMLVLAFALFFLARERSEEVLLEVLPNFWPRVLRGLLILIIMPLVGMLLIPSVVGIPIALILGALFFMLVLLSWGYAGVLLGAWSERILFKRSAFPLTYRPILLGVLFLSVISLIPVIGPLFHGILILAVAGSLGTLFSRFIRRRG